MITSEVQRTLVKSPPELWTELSDPESLARHLGELGEISITRTEPEKLVEWEAESTTGSVHIEASGWGTKVTLSVSRELPALQPGGETEMLREDQEASDEAQAATDSPAEPAAQESLQQGPGQATEAARRAAGWPATPQDAGPAIESDLRAAEAAAEPPRGEEDAPRGTSEHAPWHLPDAPEQSLPAPEAAPEPRSGFFARLFGGRRRKPAQAEAAPAADRQAPEQPAEQASFETVQPTPEPAPAGRLSAPEPDPIEPDPVPAEEPVAPEPALEASEPPAREPDSPDDATQAPEPRDLGAELKAAEEVAAKEVKAVLTAVLDRLGAAHHRPFSRA